MIRYHACPLGGDSFARVIAPSPSPRTHNALVLTARGTFSGLSRAFLRPSSGRLLDVVRTCPGRGRDGLFPRPRRTRKSLTTRKGATYASPSGYDRPPEFLFTRLPQIPLRPPARRVALARPPAQVAPPPLLPSRCRFPPLL